MQPLTHNYSKGLYAGTGGKENQNVSKFQLEEWRGVKISAKER
jgi:hypothetical protein